MAYIHAYQLNHKASRSRRRELAKFINSLKMACGANHVHVDDSNFRSGLVSIYLPKGKDNPVYDWAWVLANKLALRFSIPTNNIEWEEDYDPKCDWSGYIEIQLYTDV